MSRSEYLKIYLKVTFINMILIGVGALLAPMALRSWSIVHVVHAQNPTTSSQPSQPQVGKNESQQKAIPPCDETRFECVSPAITTGAAGFGIVLANKIGCDQLQVNGYDTLKLDNALLSALLRKGLLTSFDVSEIANSGKVEKPLRMKLR